MQRSHFYGLDFIRFAAAMAVVMFHFHQFSRVEATFHYDGSGLAFPWLAPYGWFGWIGVQVFFVLSGLVIAASAERALPLQFGVKRAVRVLPALWVSASIALLVRLLYGEGLDTLLRPFLNAIFLSPDGPYIDGVVWTLVVEAVFYAVIALAVFNDRRRGREVSRFRKLAYGMGTASGLFIALLLAANLAPQLFFADWMQRWGNRFAFDLLLLRHGVFFALGMLIYDARRHGLEPRPLFAMGVFFLLGLAQIPQVAGFALFALLPMAIWAGAVGLICASLSSASVTNRSGIARYSRPIGLLTYPLYLNHFTFGTYAVPFVAGYVANSALLFVTMLAIVLGLSAAVTFGPEKWLQSAAKRLGAGGPQLDHLALSAWQRLRRRPRAGRV